MNLTQKISQMTPKGADLAATDLIEVSTLEGGSYVTKSITGQELIDAIPAPSGFVPTSRTLTINGVAQDLSADRSWTIATGLTIGTTPIASGTIGRVLFQGTGNVLQQSSSLFWDNTGFLGIGTSTPNAPSTYNGITINSATAGSYIWFQNAGTIKYSIGSESNVNYHNLTAGTSFLIRSGGSSYFNVVQSTGNVQIGTTTDAGFRLDVNGTARVTNLNVNLSTGSIPFMGASGLVTQNNANLFWDNTNARLGIGTATPLDRLHISTNGNNIVRLSSNPTNANIISFRDIDGTGQGAFLATGSTFSYGTYRSAQTNLSGGIGGIGLRTSNGANAHISFYSGNADADFSTERLRLVASTGNLLINTTTDAGFRLDVNGTARVSGNLLVNNTTDFGYRMDVNGNVRLSGNQNTLTGSVLIGTTYSFAASAVLKIDSTTQGFLPPRMTTTQKNAIASPATGLQVFDTTLNQISYYNGTTWTNI